MPVKQFEIAHRAKGEKPVSFKLAYQDDEGTPLSEEFEVYPDRVPQFTTLRVTGSMVSQDTDSWLEFFRKAMDKEEYDRFAEFCQRTGPGSPIVDAGVLGDLIAWVTEEAAGRPTTPSSPSRRGRTKTGPS